MSALTQIQLTNEQEAMLARGEIVRPEATWDEFMDFLETTEYRVEYCNDHIIIMGLAKALHEWLVIRIATILSGFYEGKNYLVFGSNLGIHPAPKTKYHNADVTVVKDSPVFWGTSGAIITNPYLLVEILSESTKKYDLNEKTDSYRDIESLLQMIFIDGEARKIITYTRTNDPKTWLWTTYTEAEDDVLLDTFTVKLAKVFENMPVFPK